MKLNKKTLLLGSLIINSIFLSVVGYKFYNKFTAPTSNSNWMHISRSGLFKILPKNKSDVIYLGASIIQYCNWDELLKNENIRNRGIAGDTTAGILGRLNDITIGNPRKIFIMVGLNDLAKGVNLHNIRENHLKIIQSIRATSSTTKIYLYSLLPVITNTSSTSSLNDEIVKLNSLLKEICTQEKCFFIDLHKYFLSQNNQLHHHLTTDGIHLNGDGYLLWKNILEKYYTIYSLRNLNRDKYCLPDDRIRHCIKTETG